MTVNYSNIPNARKISEYTYAWASKDIPMVMDIAKENNWIILGGDVLTLQGSYTYDSWYYAPQNNVDITENVSRSVKQCVDYIQKYETLMGKQYLYSLAISNAFVGAKITDMP